MQYVSREFSSTTLPIITSCEDPWYYCKIAGKTCTNGSTTSPLTDSLPTIISYLTTIEYGNSQILKDEKQEVRLVENNWIDDDFIQCDGVRASRYREIEEACDPVFHVFIGDLLS